MEIFNAFQHQNLSYKCLKEFRNIPINHQKVNGKILTFQQVNYANNDYEDSPR